VSVLNSPTFRVLDAVSTAIIADSSLNPCQVLPSAVHNLRSFVRRASGVTF